MNTHSKDTHTKEIVQRFILTTVGVLVGLVSVAVAFPGQILSQTQYNIADINKDGIVDLTDYSILAENFFQTGQSILADINMDEIVDLTDYSILAENFFKTGPDSSPTPTYQASPTPTPMVHESPHPTLTPNPSGDAQAPNGNSKAMGKWVPNPKFDTCPVEVHESYKVVGPDGKWYPTWHPHEHTYSNGTKCTFGHEHGRDPKLSPLFPKMQEMYYYDANSNGSMDTAEKAVTGVPFAYANEQYDVYNASIGKPLVHRHEDHVGHKVEWERFNQAYEGATAADRRESDIVCDVAGIIHQGTNSKDAFTNNLHAATGFMSCNRNGYDARITILAAFNKPGQFGEALPCNPRGTQIILGTDSVNSNYPSGGPNTARNVLTRKCVNEFMLVPSGQFSGHTYEDWRADLVLTDKSGKRLNMSPVGGFTVFNPVRFYDPGKPLDVGYLMDLCYEVEPNGDRMRGACHVTEDGRVTGITWDDPRSQFRGDMRETYFQADPITNAGGTAIIYTDPLGNNGQSTPFPGSIKQYLTPANISYGPQLGGPLTPSAFGADRGYGTMGGSGKWGHNTVHSPN